MNMKAMISAVLALVLAIGGTAYFAARNAQTNPVLAPPLPPGQTSDQHQENPFDLQATGPKPKVVAKETHLDFGVMALGTEQSHEFIIENTGEGPLKLAKGPLMCKCTMPAVPNSEIPPGGSMPINLTWKPVEMTSLFSKEAVIWTNDPEKPKIILSIEGKVFPDPTIMPGNFSLGEIPWDRERVSQIHVFSSIVGDMEIVSSETSHPEWMKASWERIPDGELRSADPSAPKPLIGYELSLTLLPFESAGPFSGWVKLKLKHKEEPVKIDVTGSRSGPIMIHGPDYQASRSVVDLKRFKSADGRTSRLFLFLEPFGEDLQVTEVISKSKNLTATLQKQPQATGARQGYVLLIQAEKGITSGTTFTLENPDSLTIKTNHPKVPELRFISRYIVQ